MSDDLAEAWLINHRVSRRFLEGLSPEAITATLSTRGGRSVGQQMVHVNQVRVWKIEAADKKLAATLPAVERDDGHDRELLLAAFEASAEAIASLARKSQREDEGRIKGFKRGIAAWIAYLITHEAHHRGHALLTIKQCGIKRPPELQMGLWEWNKI